MRRFTMSHGTSWMSKNYFAFFETEDFPGTCIETYACPNGWDYSEPEDLLPYSLGENA